MAAFLRIDDGCPDGACNAAFELLHKAQAEDPSGVESGLWAEHPNPWLQHHVADTGSRLRDALARIADGFAAVLNGEPVHAETAKAESWRDRFGSLAAARRYLATRVPAQYTLDDWLLLADVMVDEHLPTDRIADEAERLAVRAVMLGRLQAAAAVAGLGAATIGRLVVRLPVRAAALPAVVLPPPVLAGLEWAKARAGLAITDISDAARRGMKAMVVEHVQAVALGQPEARSSALQTRLFDRFADLNRDIRRIVVTEIGECANQGYIASLEPGARVRRVEDYVDACAFCASINGRVFTVVDPRKPNKDGDTEVWHGKDNVGRSASPAKRVGGVLQPRDADELWWVAAGVIHPNCRGRWVAAGDSPPPAGVAPEFALWLRGLIADATHGKD